MKVGLITDLIDQGSVSGTVYISNLVRNFSEFTELELVLIHKEKTDNPIYSQIDHITMIDSHYMPRLRYRDLLPLFLRRCKLNLVHFPDLYAGASPPMTTSVLQHSVVATFHGASPLEVPFKYHFTSKRAFLRYRLAFSRYLFIHKVLRKKRNFVLITISKASRDSLIRYLKVPEEKTRVVYHGVNLEEFKPLTDSEEAKEIIGQKYAVLCPFILCVSNYQPKKNFVTLVRALHKLRKKYKLDYGLVMVGRMDERYQDVPRVIAKLNLQDYIHHVGFVSARDLVKLYNAADLFVLPSLHEGFGFPVLEAMACGTPVIASNVFSIPEIVGDAGILVDPLNVDGFTEAMYNILTDEGLRKELSEKGVKRSKLFTWERTAKETLKVYREALSL